MDPLSLDDGEEIESPSLYSAANSPQAKLEAKAIREKRIKVTVRTLKGMSFKLALKPEATIYSVKQKLAQTSDGTSPDLQNLFHGQKLLEDHNSVSSYHIRPGTVLDMEPPTISIMLVGSKGVGKTALMSSFMNPMQKLSPKAAQRDYWKPEVYPELDQLDRKIIVIPQ